MTDTAELHSVWVPRRNLAPAALAGSPWKRSRSIGARTWGVDRAAASVRVKRPVIGGSGTVNRSSPTTPSVERPIALSIRRRNGTASFVAKLSRADPIGLSVLSGAGTAASAFRRSVGSCG
jgi:hypothetical protein